MVRKHKVNLKNTFTINFLGGIAWGLGATIGLAIVLALLGFLIGKLNLIPVVGSFLADILKPGLQNQPQLLK